MNNVIAVRLAQLRGEAMQVASEMEQSGMITVLYKHSTRIHEVLAKAKEYAASEGVNKPVCEVAHFLFPHCKVLAGHTQCLDFIEKNWRDLDLERVRRLPLQGAPHTQLMEPAAYTFRKYLVRSTLQDPVIAVHSGLDGKCYKDKGDVVNKLPKLIMKPVKWEQLMHVLYERPVGQHFPYTFECGPGNTLKTIMKMVNSKAYDVCETVF
ncbi:hypothetical protein J6590_070754 [Homalodisca vitripennis]|nr:hypothetical protein J6590_070754 [Homalodisca vitripennis]